VACRRVAHSGDPPNTYWSYTASSMIDDGAHDGPPTPLITQMFDVDLGPCAVDRASAQATPTLAADPPMRSRGGDLDRLEVIRQCSRQLGRRQAHGKPAVSETPGCRLYAPDNGGGAPGVTIATSCWTPVHESTSLTPSRTCIRSGLRSASPLFASVLSFDDATRRQRAGVMPTRCLKARWNAASDR
jgi:hypothetical protein